MTTNPPTGAFSFEALMQAEPGAMPPGGESATHVADSTQEAIREVQVFTSLAMGLHEGLHREFVRVP
jgi:hypothetical protein